MPLSEESFRALLDPSGAVRDPSALPVLAPDARFLVFSQAAGARFDAAGWREQAARFFAAKLGFTHDKRPASDPPLVDAARVVIAAERANGTRLVIGRPREPGDLACAEDAELRAGGGGLGELARRCGHVYVVEASGPDDRASLSCAAILASVALGPIVSPDGRIFGVRTARLELEREASGYR